MSRTGRWAGPGSLPQLGLLGFSLLMVGCASPGPPRAPSLHLPEAVSGTKAERRGDAVVLKFAAPLRSTEKELLEQPVLAGLCRAVADGPCLATASFPKKITIAGAVEWVDVLPPQLAYGAPRRLAYRVETFNPKGRGAGPSEPVFAAAGAAPTPLSGLRAEGSRAGVVLRWVPESVMSGEVLLQRELLNPPPPTKATKKPVAVPRIASGKKKHGPVQNSTLARAGETPEPNIIWLHAEGTGERDPGGMVDGTAKADGEYRYTALRSRTETVDDRKLELRSDASAPVTLTLRDIYPPAVPQGLLAAGFAQQKGIAVDLVWQPNVETELADYNVYRQTMGSDAAPVKLNDKPVALPAFHDGTAARGLSYRYTVTAVDGKGNESAASVAADLAATP